MAPPLTNMKSRSSVAWWRNKDAALWSLVTRPNSKKYFILKLFSTSNTHIFWSSYYSKILQCFKGGAHLSQFSNAHSYLRSSLSPIMLWMKVAHIAVSHDTPVLNIPFITVQSPHYRYPYERKHPTSAVFLLRLLRLFFCAFYADFVP